MQGKPWQAYKLTSTLHNQFAHSLYASIFTQIAADNAVFGQTGPKVGSFDAGYGSTHMARLIGTVTDTWPSR